MLNENLTRTHDDKLALREKGSQAASGDGGKPRL
jgi:hypothetical protein